MLIRAGLTVGGAAVVLVEVLSRLGLLVRPVVIGVWAVGAVGAAVFGHRQVRAVAAPGGSRGWSPFPGRPRSWSHRHPGRPWGCAWGPQRRHPRPRRAAPAHHVARRAAAGRGGRPGAADEGDRPARRRPAAAAV